MEIKKKWVVTKFGGTSVSSLGTYKSIAKRTSELLKEGHKVWIVLSAVSQVTNKLIACLDECVSLASNPLALRSLKSTDSSSSSSSLDGGFISDPCASYTWIVERHRALAKEMGLQNMPIPEGLGAGQDDIFDPLVPPAVSLLLAELRKILGGVILTGEVSPRLRARVLSFGELISTHFAVCILAKLLPEISPEKELRRVDARRLLVATEKHDEAEEDRYLQADVQPTKCPDLCEKEAGGPDVRVVVTQGFIARTSRSGLTCLLGRGGSDTSGALFAAMTDAERCEIWTDVHGMFTCDPRLVPSARIILEMTYREGQELAAMGAKVLHPRCIGPCNWGRIPLVIRNTMDPDSTAMTVIGGPSTSNEPRVLAVAKRTDQVLITIENFDMWGASGFLSQVFAPFAKYGVSVSLIATSEYAVSMTLDHIPGNVEGDVFAGLIRDLQQLAPPGGVQFESGCAVVSVIGRKLRSSLHHLSGLFDVVGQGKWGVRMVTESAEDLNMSFVVGAGSRVDDLVLALHETLKFDGAHFGEGWETILKSSKSFVPSAGAPSLPSEKLKPPVAAVVNTPAPTIVANNNNSSSSSSSSSVNNSNDNNKKKEGDAVMGTPLSGVAVPVSSLLGGGSMMGSLSLDSSSSSFSSSDTIGSDHDIVFPRLSSWRDRAMRCRKTLVVALTASDAQDTKLLKALADAKISCLCSSLEILQRLKQKTSLTAIFANAFESADIASMAQNFGADRVLTHHDINLAKTTNIEKTLDSLETTGPLRRGSRADRWSHLMNVAEIAKDYLIVSSVEVLRKARLFQAPILYVNEKDRFIAVQLVLDESLTKKYEFPLTEAVQVDDGGPGKSRYQIYGLDEFGNRALIANGVVVHHSLTSKISEWKILQLKA